MHGQVSLHLKNFQAIKTEEKGDLNLEVNHFTSISEQRLKVKLEIELCLSTRALLCEINGRRDR